MPVTLKSRWSGWGNLAFPALRAGGHFPGGLCLRGSQQRPVPADRFAVDPRQLLDLALAGPAIK